MSSPRDVHARLQDLGSLQHPGRSLQPSRCVDRRPLAARSVQARPSGVSCVSAELRSLTRGVPTGRVSVMRRQPVQRAITLAGRPVRSTCAPTSSARWSVANPMRRSSLWSVTHERGGSRLTQQRLGGEKFSDAPGPELATVSRILESAERSQWVLVSTVYLYLPGPDSLGDPGGALVVAPDDGGEPIAGQVG
jgi:hypothetical protein